MSGVTERTKWARREVSALPNRSRVGFSMRVRQQGGRTLVRVSFAQLSGEAEVVVDTLVGLHSAIGEALVEAIKG